MSETMRVRYMRLAKAKLRNPDTCCTRLAFITADLAYQRTPQAHRDWWRKVRSPRLRTSYDKQMSFNLTHLLRGIDCPPHPPTIQMCPLGTIRFWTPEDLNLFADPTVARCRPQCAHHGLHAITASLASATQPWPNPPWTVYLAQVVAEWTMTTALHSEYAFLHSAPVLYTPAPPPLPWTQSPSNARFVRQTTLAFTTADSVAVWWSPPVLTDFGTVAAPARPNQDAMQAFVFTARRKTWTCLPRIIPRPRSRRPLTGPDPIDWTPFLAWPDFRILW